MKKLVDKTIGRHRRKKQELAEEQLASEEAERGRSIVERGTLKDDGPGALIFDDKDNASQSSLVTFDDEPARYVHNRFFIPNIIHYTRFCYCIHFWK